MNHLLRELAPISDAGWRELDREARDRLEPALAARKLVDFSGPHGWEHSATNLGRVEGVDGGPVEGVSTLRRRVLPLVELRVDFALARSELRDLDRGADDGDWGPLDEAAHRLATAENVAVFHRWQDAIRGIADATPHERVPLGGAPEDVARSVAGAVERLLRSGVAGPYGVAFGSDPYRMVLGASEHGGYPLLKHLGRIVDGPIAWAPGVEGAVVVSLRGGDFVFDAGQDISIGYDGHDADVVRLYLEESFSFHAATPEAAVALA